MRSRKGVRPVPADHQEAPTVGIPAPMLNTKQLSARWRSMMTREKWRTAYAEAVHTSLHRRTVLALCLLYCTIAEIRFRPTVTFGVFRDMARALDVLPQDPISRAECLLLALEVVALTTEDLERPPVGTGEGFILSALEDLQGMHPAVRRRLAALGAPDWLEVKRRLAGPEPSAWLQAFAEKRQRPLQQ